MNEELKDIFNNMRRHSLSEGERVSMRNNLLAHMAEHPAKAPLSIRMQDAFSDMLAGQGVGMRFVPATLAIVFVVGIGTAYAAEGALPGDALYGMKLNINESVKGAFAVSESAQASWNTEKIERRLVEAETLVAEGRLTVDAQALLEAEINSAVIDFDKSVAKLAAIESEAAVATAQSDLEASLIGHAEVLVALTATTDTVADAQAIILSVLNKAEAAQVARASNEATLTAKRADVKIKAAAIANKTKAMNAVSAVRAKATAKKDATSTSQVAQESAVAAEVAITEADRRMNEGDYGTAFTVLQEAIRTVQTTEVRIDASERLNADVKIFSRTTGGDKNGATMMSVEPTVDAALMKSDQ